MGEIEGPALAGVVDGLESAGLEIGEDFRPDGLAFTNDQGVDTAWTFLPYMIVFVLLLIVAGMCFWAITRTPEWMDDDA